MRRRTPHPVRRGVGALWPGMLCLILCPGCGIPSFLVTPVQNVRSLEEETVREGKGWRQDKILIVEVEGLLLNARTGGFLQPGENDVSLFVQQLEKAEHDSSVKAVVLRVNSPGGTVAASEVMYETLLRWKARTQRPIVASAQDLAASGGYYVSCAADRIVVQPSSVVGSIGVIFQTFDISGTMDKIGARSEAIKSGPLKDMGSFFKPLTDPERIVMQKMVDDYHARFKVVVQTNRKLDDRQLAAVSDGRVFTGNHAVSLGLADQAGLLDDAIDLAKDLAKVPDARVIMYKRPYGYTGSIYATASTPRPEASVINLNVAPPNALLPTGFYYLWQP